MVRLPTAPMLLISLLVVSIGCNLLSRAEETPTPFEVTRTKEELAEIEITQTTEGPIGIEIHVWQTYDGDEVEIKIDEQIVFSDAVTTNDILSLAATIPVSVSEGSHNIGVTVNGSIDAEATFDTQDLLVIAVSYSPQERKIAFDFLDFRPAYR